MIKKINTLLLDVTYNCNFRCKHCYNSKNLSEDSDLNVNKIKSIIKKFNIDHLHLLGGEPLLHKNINRLIDENKNVYFSINTNGSLIKKFIEKGYFRDNIKEWVISIDGFSQITNDSVRGSGTFDIVKENLNYLLKFKKNNFLNFKVTLATVITPENSCELKKLNFANIFSVDNYLFSTIMNFNSENNIYNKLDFNYYMNYCEFLDKLMSSNIINYVIDTTPLILYIYGKNINEDICNPDNLIFYSDNRGDIFSCGPEKYYIKTNKKIKSICKSCKFYYLCSKCKLGLYLDRSEYCRNMMIFLSNRFKEIILTKNIILKSIDNTVYLICLSKNVKYKFNKKIFNSIFTYNDNKIYISSIDNPSILIEYFKFLLATGEYVL